MELFKLIGTIMVDSADADKSIQKTETKASSLGTKMAEGAKTAAAWGAGIVTAAAGAGAALVAAAKGVTADLDAIDKGSQRMGITAESYQEIAYAAGLCGVNMSTMEAAAKKLEGTGLPLDQAIENLMSISDETARTQAAIDLFGEGIAYQLAPLLKTGAEGYAEMKDEAHQLGIVMSDEAVAAGAELGDSFSKVEQSMKAAGENILVSFFPVIQKILDWVLENVPIIQEKIQSLMDKIMPVVETAVTTILELLPPIMDAIIKVVDAIIPVVEPIIQYILGAIPPILEVITTVLDAIVPLIEPVMDAIMTIIDGIIPIIQPIFDTIIGMVQPMMDIITGAIDLVLPYIQPVVDAVTALFEGFYALFDGDFKGFWDGIVTYVTGMVAVFLGLGSDIINALWDGIKNVWESVSEWFTGASGNLEELWDGIVDYITGLGSVFLDLGKDLMNSLWEGLEDVWSGVGDWFSNIGDQITGWFSDIGSGISGWWDGLWGGDGDGSHAAGLATVPYDGYRATLHKGETVLNENDTRKIQDMVNGESGESGPATIIVQSVLDGKVIGESAYQYSRRKSRAMGV